MPSLLQHSMSLSYLVSTAGHAQAQNDQHPHDIRTILQLIEEGRKELQDEKVVGFTGSSESDRGEWVCERLCTLKEAVRTGSCKC